MDGKYVPHAKVAEKLVPHGYVPPESPVANLRSVLKNGYLVYWDNPVLGGKFELLLR
jgi:hypothetical protein